MTSDTLGPAEWFEQRRRELPDRAKFLVAGNTEVTFGDVDTYIDQFVAFSNEEDLKPGASVLILSRDPVVVGKTIVAAFRSGLSICVLEPTSSTREVRFALLQIAPALVLADAETIERCGLAEGGPWRTIPLAGRRKSSSLADRLLGRAKADEGESWATVLASQEAKQATHPELTGDEIVMLVFTSGSSSRPKAVEIRLSAVLSHLEAFSVELELAGSTFQNILPLSHVDGFLAPVLAYFRGATWVRPCDFSVGEVPEILDSVYREQITHMFVVPTMLALFERLGTGMEDAFETERFQTIISSAGPLGVDLWERFERKFNTHVCNSYGLSETVTSSIVSGPPGSSSRRVGTIGKPLPGCDVRLVDSDGGLVETGSVGEIEIGGAHLFTRYRGDQELTDAVKHNGAFRTGDLALQSPDGFFELVGRRSSMIISGGHNIAPDELNGVIGQMANVSEVATVGIDDPMWGQRIETAVVARGPLSVEEILRHCRDELSPFKVPHRVTIVEGLPLTNSGKLDSTALAAVLGAAGTTIDGRTIEDVVLDLAGKVFGVDQETLTLSSSIDSVDGWDSLGHLDLIGEIEDAFDFVATNTDILAIRNLADAVEVARRGSHS